MGCVLLLICHRHVEGILGLVCYLVLHLDKFLLTAVFVEFDLVAIGVDLEVKLEVATFFGAWLRVEELFIIRLRQEFLIPRRCKILVESKLWLLCRGSQSSLSIRLLRIPYLGAFVGILHLQERRQVRLPFNS